MSQNTRCQPGKHGVQTHDFELQKPGSTQTVAVSEQAIEDPVVSDTPHRFYHHTPLQRAAQVRWLQCTFGNRCTEQVLKGKQHFTLQDTSKNPLITTLVQPQSGGGYITQPAHEFDNDGDGLQNSPLKELFELYATTHPAHQLPTARNIYSHDWIYGSAGSGRIRQVIREKLETEIKEPKRQEWFLNYAASLSGHQERRKELQLMMEDAFAKPGWQAANQIAIEAAWPDWRKRYAALWNQKGALFTSLACEVHPQIKPYVAAGIMAAETGIQFFNQGRVIVRFEAHVFRKRWGDTSKERRRLFRDHFVANRPHRWRRNVSDAFHTYHGKQDSEWEVLDFARTLDAEANIRAVESASFGAGQTMGFNYARAGFGSALELLQHYQTREQVQVEGIFSYIKTIPSAKRRQKVIKGIIENNFLPLSQAYGPQNPTAHAERIDRAVNRMRQVVQAAQPETMP